MFFSLLWCLSLVCSGAFCTEPELSPAEPSKLNLILDGRCALFIRRLTFDQTWIHHLHMFRGRSTRRLPCNSRVLLSECTWKHIQGAGNTQLRGLFTLLEQKRTKRSTTTRSSSTKAQTQTLSHLAAEHFTGRSWQWANWTKSNQSHDYQNNTSVAQLSQKWSHDLIISLFSRQQQADCWAAAWWCESCWASNSTWLPQGGWKEGK